MDARSSAPCSETNAPEAASRRGRDRAGPGVLRLRQQVRDRLAGQPSMCPHASTGTASEQSSRARAADVPGDGLRRATRALTSSWERTATATGSEVNTDPGIHEHQHVPPAVGGERPPLRGAAHAHPRPRPGAGGTGDRRDDQATRASAKPRQQPKRNRIVRRNRPSPSADVPRSEASRPSAQVERGRTGPWASARLRLGTKPGGASAGEGARGCGRGGSRWRRRFGTARRW